MQIRVHPPLLARKCYPSSLNWKVKTKKQELYITFDDGPIPEITPWVLDTLDKYNAKATFFCIARNVERHPEIFQDIISRGHAVGNHSYSHYKGMWNNKGSYIEDVEMSNQLIKSSLFRPPHGRISRKLIRVLEKEYTLIMWDVLSCDFDLKVSKEQCLKNVLKYTTNGSIIVFHDSLKAKNNMMYSFERSLAHFKEQGYAFKTLSAK